MYTCGEPHFHKKKEPQTQDDDATIYVVYLYIEKTT